MFSASSLTISIIQILSTVLSILGLWFFDFTLVSVILIFLGYFLYSGIGISMTMHRYWTHRSFEFKYKCLLWICTWFAIVAGRGSTIGWINLHRLHHTFADTNLDPHNPNILGWKIFFPYFMKNSNTVNKRTIKDILTKEHLFINRYYILFLLIWSLFLFLIDIKILYFFYIIPLMLTFIGLNLFVILTHKYGYKNFYGNDNSKNNWFISLILWGEGWHNNHHNNVKNYSTRVKWWEFDILEYIIKFLKK